MNKTNKIIISIGAAVIVVATILIVALVKDWNEDDKIENTGYYTLQPTTTQAIPVDTSSWIDINLIASDIVTNTDTSSTDASTNLSTSAGLSGYGQGYFFDAYGNLVDIYGNIIVPNYQLQGNQNQGGGGNNTPQPTVDSTQALDVPVTEESELQEYVLDEQGVITEYLGDRTILIIPSQIQGKTITGIGTGCFKGTDIVSVQIPATVSVIENGAFENCTRLTSVSFVSESVHVSIGSSAFANCTSLTDIKLPAVTLYNAAFLNCSSLKTAELAPGSKQIGGYAFSNCTSLKYVKVPSSVKKENIGTNVFLGCPETFYVVADLESDAYTAFKDLGIKVETHE